MKYKVFYNGAEQVLVNEFDTLKECREFILISCRINKTLKPKDFSIYGLIN